MNLASKENSVEFSEQARRLKSEQNPRANQKNERRVALSAKPLNTDSNVSLGSPRRTNHRKRSSFGAQQLFDNNEGKRIRLVSPLGPTSSILDGEQTDEDEEQSLNYISKKTPQSRINARRAESHQNAVFPRFKLADLIDLEVDLPSTNKNAPLPDEAEDILKGFDFSQPRKLQHPFLTSKWIAEVEANSKITLDDFPDLDYSDADSDALSTIGLDTPVT